MAPRVLIIDNYDSFTYNLAQYLWEMGYHAEVFRNNAIDIAQIHSWQPSHIVISPGPGGPQDSGICMSMLKEFATKVPILGVCLGHQCLGAHYGSEISRAPKPMHGKVSEIEHDGTGIFNGLASPLKATRYHSLVVAESSIDTQILRITARSKDDNLVMGLQHFNLPLVGVQFHPESIMSQSGHDLLRNFIELFGDVYNK